MASRAEDIGMKVNVKKTQLLCISPSNGCVTTASLQPTPGGDWINLGEKLKRHVQEEDLAPVPLP